MIHEIGVIEGIDGKIATVKVDKKDECSKCGMCLFPKGVSSVEFTAENNVGAEIGDTVVIKRNKDDRLVSTLLVFFVPLVLIGLACAVVFLYGLNEIFVLPISIGLIVLWFIVLARIEKKHKKSVNHAYVVLSIIKSKEKI